MRSGAGDVGADPLDGAPDLRQAAAGDGELAEQGPVRSLDQAIEELAFGERREHADVRRRVEQAQQPQQRRLQIRRERADAEARAGRAGAGRPELRRRDVDQQAGDGGRIEQEADRQIRRPRGRLDHLPRHRQIGGEQHVALAAIHQRPAAEGDALAALQHEADHRGIDRRQRRGRGRPGPDRHARDGRGRALAGAVPPHDVAQLVECGRHGVHAEGCGTARQAAFPAVDRIRQDFRSIGRAGRRLRGRTLAA